MLDHHDPPAAAPQMPPTEVDDIAEHQTSRGSPVRGGRALWSGGGLLPALHERLRRVQLAVRALAAMILRAVVAVRVAARAGVAPNGELDSTGDDGWQILPEPASANGAAAKRGRALRSGGLLAVLVFALFVALNGPATAVDAARAEWRQLLERWTQQASDATGPSLNASSWVASRLAGQAQFVRGIELRPAPSDPQTAYLCWRNGLGPDGHTGPLFLFATPDGGYAWNALVPPVSRASDCRLVVDLADPARVVLEIPSPTTTGCVAPLLFASADRGARWTHVTLPEALRDRCDLALSSIEGWLYVSSPSAQRWAPTSSAAQLLATSNDGTSWFPAISGLAPGALASVVAGRADGAVLTLVRTNLGAGLASTAVLKCAASAGAAWVRVGAVPVETPLVFVASDPHAARGCDWGAVYAARFDTADGLPAVGAPLVLIETNSPKGWRTLPPLPVAGATHTLPAGDGAAILGVGPGGILLAEAVYTDGVGPFYQGGVSPAHLLWGWDPSSLRWLPDTHPEYVNSVIEGIAWNAGPPHGATTVTLWLYVLNAGSPAITNIFRATIAQVGRAVDPPGR